MGTGGSPGVSARLQRRSLGEDLHLPDFRELSADLPDFRADYCHAREAMKNDAPLESPKQPALPAWKAFVVQFSYDSRSQGATFSGRVEHLSSGRRAQFASPEHLVALLRTLLDELGKPAE